MHNVIEKGLPLHLEGVAHALGLRWWTKDSMKLLLVYDVDKFYSQFYICYTWAPQWAVQVWTDSVKANKHHNRVSQQRLYKNEVCPKRYTNEIHQRGQRRQGEGGELYNVG